MEIFNDINLFYYRNRQLRNCFLFFFFIAICGYISLMVSFCPYSDDYCRYLANLHIGTSDALRNVTFLLERLFYLSDVITDAAPFTHIISCLLLAYSACVCLRTFKVNITNKWEAFCFAPVIINPYIFEIMMYRFDNPFITLALLIAILSAYISSKNEKRWLFVQTALLFLTLFIYQAVISAYLIIFLYKFITELLHSNTNLFQTVNKMKYWFCTLFFTALFYAPFTLFLSYCTSAKNGVFVIPYNLENIKIIIENICRYFSILYTDWSPNTIGQIFFAMLFIFLMNTIIKTAIKTKPTIAHIITVSFCLFLLTLSPSGVYALLRVAVFEGNESIFPRMLCSIGILISLVLHENYLLFKQIKITGNFFAFLLVIFNFWNIVFLNSASNIIHYFRSVQQHAAYDISKDIFDITNVNKKISRVCITGSIETEATKNFFKEYPIMDRIIPEKWCIPTYCQIALMNNEFAKQILELPPITKIYKENEYSTKKQIKTHMFYETFIIDDNLLLVSMKKNIKFKSSFHSMIRIKSEKDTKE